MKKSIYTTEEQFYYLVMKQKKLKSIYNRLLKPVRYDFLEEIKKHYEINKKNTIFGIENIDKIITDKENQIISIQIDQGYVYDYMISKNKDNFLLTQINTTYKIKDINKIYEEIKDYIVEVEAYLNPNKEIHSIIDKDLILDFRINQEKNKIFYEEIKLNINKDGYSEKKAEIDERIEKELKIIEHKIGRELKKKNINFNSLKYVDSIYRSLNSSLEMEINKIQKFLIELNPLDLMQFDLIDLKKELKEKELKKEIVKEPKMNDFMKRVVNETLTIKNILENGSSELIELIENEYEKTTTVFTLKASSIEDIKKHISNSINKLNSLTVNLKKEYEEIRKKSSKLELLDYNVFCNEFEDVQETIDNIELSY